ncbi:Glucosyltransferase-like protein [Agyrium rufum]|nr:Glucosyltransferase-like protein [Agyrium rufum]
MSSTSTPHKARKRKEASNTPDAAMRPSNTALSGRSRTVSSSQNPQFPLASFFWPAKKGTSSWVVLPLILLMAGLFRWAVGLWGYSGLGIPPMHGDFEAQRHWMEITTHLPMSKWYSYDLQYWGLDYPPLTAYHSWLLGKIGSFIEPDWFSLDISRGIETSSLKLYMRSTVIVSEYLIYIPAAVIFTRRLTRLSGVSTWESWVVLSASLLQPATMLIDHAHFQYNTVMLGFVLASMSSVLAGRLLWACVFFVAALSFKQMALYYAPAMFAYLLGVCLEPELKLGRLGTIAAVTAASFAAAFAPLVLGSLYEGYTNPTLSVDLQPPPLLVSLQSLLHLNPKALYYTPLLQVMQALHRIFPFARGIFEDKVANFWCVLHTVHKLNRYSVPTLQRTSVTFTLMSILPTCMTISLASGAKKKVLLPWALAACAWGFFLFSFQVHEKSVLLPLLPMTALLAGKQGLGTEIRAWVGWANVLGAWTMYPLLKRDELRIPYFVLTCLWIFLLGLPPTTFALYATPKSKGGLTLVTKILHLSFYLAMTIWHVLEAFVPPPEGKPDLWVVINVVVGAAGFVLCWAWCSAGLILRSEVLEDYFGVRLRLEKEGLDPGVWARRKEPVASKKTR